MNIRGPLYFITKKTGKAVWDYKMISDGDKIILAVSGGKDSLCLLRIMQERLKFVPITYELIACHVDMGFPWVNTDTLRSHFEKEGVASMIVDPPEGWQEQKDSFDCFWCSWNRRKAIFDLAGRMGANKIAFAHHMDDIIETMLLNLFFQGEIGTMMPYQEMFGGELAIIRPLAYVEEHELTRLAGLLKLPVAASACPHGDISKRALMKGIVGNLRQHNRNVKKNIFRSLTRIRQDYLPEIPPT